MNRAERRELQFNNFNYLNVDDFLDNLTGSIFRWVGWGDIAPASERREIILQKQGKRATFDTTVGPLELDCTLTRKNHWGEWADASAQPIIYGPQYFEIKTGPDAIPPIVIYDQPNHRKIRRSLLWYIDTLGKLRRAIETSIMWLKTPMIFQTTEEGRDSTLYLAQAIEAGLPAVAIYEDSINIEGITLTPTNVSPAIVQTLFEMYARIEAMAYKEIGVPDITYTKQAQLTQTEILIPMLDTTLKNVARHHMRMEYCAKVQQAYNEKYNLGLNLGVMAPSLGVVEASLLASTGHAINLTDLNNNGIPDKVEKEV